ncbi:MAG: nickel-type superoxide dismutase maturation protease, partial [Acidimicrobiales bacterium]
MVNPPARSTRGRWPATITLSIVALAAGTAAAAGLVRRVQVEGASMAPALLPGDRLLVVKWPRLKPGEVVVVRDPRHPARVLVKRVARVDQAGRTLEILGDAPGSSTDSRTFGPLSRSSVL